MVRVLRRPAVPPAARTSNYAAKRRSGKWRVVFETVTQQRKKLRSSITFEAEAPPGYTFVLAGNPRLTTACKERCRTDGLKVYAVTTTPHMQTHDLSQHVHRIGFHFPSAVVASVCMELGFYLTATGKAVPYYTVGETEYQSGASPEVSQVTINTEAREILRDLFPNIPDNDLYQIIKTAFQKGQKRVGTANELPLARRAQLAVVAHIRHLYTDYDRLLKTTSFHEARTLVEKPTLGKLMEWRGDDENGTTRGFEDVIREVIVISDDEEYDTEEEPHVTSGYHADHNVEPVSSYARPKEPYVRPIVYGPSSVPGASYQGSASRIRYVRTEAKKKKIDRRGFVRYEAAWDRALRQYRSAHAVGKPAEPTRYDVHGHQDQQRVAHGTGDACARDHPAEAGVPVSRNAPAQDRSEGQWNANYEKLIPMQPARQPPQPSHHPQSNPAHSYGEPVYQRTSLHRNQQLMSPLHDSLTSSVFVSGPTESPRKYRSRTEQPTNWPPLPKRRILDPQDRVLPSVEVPYAPNQDVGHVPADRVEFLTRRISNGFALRSVTPTQRPGLDSTRSGNAAIGTDSRRPSPKRRRLAEDVTSRDTRDVQPELAPDGVIFIGTRRVERLPLRPHARNDLLTKVGGGLTLNGAPLSNGQPKDLPPAAGRPPFVQDDHTPTWAPMPPKNWEIHGTSQPQMVEPHGYHPMRAPLRRTNTSSDTVFLVPVEDRTRSLGAVPDPRVLNGRHVEYSHHANSRSGPRPLERTEWNPSPGFEMSAGRFAVAHDAPRERYVYAADFVRPVDPHDPAGYEQPRPNAQAFRPAASPAEVRSIHRKVVNPHEREYVHVGASEVHPSEARHDARAAGQGPEYVIPDGRDWHHHGNGTRVGAPAPAPATGQRPELSVPLHSARYAEEQVRFLKGFETHLVPEALHVRS